MRRLRPYYALARKTVEANVRRLDFPFKLTFCLTFWCNYRCETCNIWKMKPRDELRLDEFWTHPDNRGWMTLFSMWAKSPTFRAAWQRLSRTFGIRFGHFCHQRFGLADPDAAIRDIDRREPVQEAEE